MSLSLFVLGSNSLSGYTASQPSSTGSLSVSRTYALALSSAPTCARVSHSQSSAAPASSSSSSSATATSASNAEKDAAMIAVSLSSGSTVLVHAQSGTVLDTLFPPFSAALDGAKGGNGNEALLVSFSPQNRYLAVVYAGTNVVIWNLKATPRKPIRQFSPFSWDRRATAVAWDRAGEHLVIGDSDGSVWVYVVATGRLHSYSLSRSLVMNSSESAVPAIQVGGVSAMSSSPYRRGVFLIATDAGHILSLDLYAAGLSSATVSVLPIPSPHTPGTPLSAVHHSPVNNLLAFSTGLDGKCVFFDTSLRKIVKTLHHPPGPISSACFLEDGAHIVLLSRRENGRAYVYDLRKAATSSAPGAPSSALNIFDTNGGSMVVGGLAVASDAKPVPGVAKEREEWIRPDVPMSLVAVPASSTSTAGGAAGSAVSSHGALSSSSLVDGGPKTNSSSSAGAGAGAGAGVGAGAASLTSLFSPVKAPVSKATESTSVLQPATDAAPVREHAAVSPYSSTAASTGTSRAAVGSASLPPPSSTSASALSSSATSAPRKTDLFSPVKNSAPSSASMADAATTAPYSSSVAASSNIVSPLSRPAGTGAAVLSSSQTVIPERQHAMHYSPVKKTASPLAPHGHDMSASASASASAGVSQASSATPGTPLPHEPSTLAGSSISPVPLSFHSLTPQQQQQQHLPVQQPQHLGAGQSVPSLNAQSSDMMISLLSSTMEDAMVGLREQLHSDVQNMHLELLRQFATQQDQLEDMIERMVGPVLRSLVSEVKMLREENDRLKNMF
eukprot:ANDGO_07077.mRNA.1 hypothetical protein AMSG_12456